MWLIQEKALKAGEPGPEWKYVSYWHPDAAQSCEEASSWLAGHIHSEYWDHSDHAGPPKRPTSGFDEALPTLQVLHYTGTALMFLGVRFETAIEQGYQTTWSKPMERPEWRRCVRS